MKRNMIILMVFGIISTGIAVYQFIEGRMLDGMLSVLLAGIFIAGGWSNYKKMKAQAGNTI